MQQFIGCCNMSKSTMWYQQRPQSDEVSAQLRASDFNSLHQKNANRLITVTENSQAYDSLTANTHTVHLISNSKTVAYLRGRHWAMAQRFLAPKFGLKRRLTGYYCYLILRKITKFVATRCQILRLKCTKFNFGWGSAPDPAGGAYSAPQTP